MTPPREPRTAAGRELLSLMVGYDWPNDSASYVLAIEAAGAPLRERDYGLVFGKVMQKHPKADVRLVNDVLRTTLDVLAATADPAPLDVEALLRAMYAVLPYSNWTELARDTAERLAAEYARLTARAAATEDTDAPKRPKTFGPDPRRVTPNG